MANISRPPLLNQFLSETKVLLKSVGTTPSLPPLVAGFLSWTGSIYLLWEYEQRPGTVFCVCTGS